MNFTSIASSRLTSPEKSGPVQPFDGARHRGEPVVDDVAEAVGACRRRNPMNRVEVAGELRELEPDVRAELPARELPWRMTGTRGRSSLRLADLSPPPRGTMP